MALNTSISNGQLGSPGRYLYNSMMQRQTEFSEWITPHLEMLYRNAWRFTGHHQDAEDLVQELLLRLYQKPQRWKTLDKPAAWLVRSLHNLFVDQWRVSRHKPLNNRQNLPWEELVGHEEFADTDLERLAQSEILQRRIRRMLDDLPREQCAIVVLHDMEGYTMSELTALLGLPLGTVKSRLFRARRHLRQAFLSNGNLEAEIFVLGNMSRELTPT